MLLLRSIPSFVSLFGASGFLGCYFSLEPAARARKGNKELLFK
jgi:hypothetical protein